eukprot:gene40367-53356_t
MAESPRWPGSRWQGSQRRIGLTGGIGCGKTTVANRFAELGATLVDTDEIAHALTAPHGAAMAAIVAVAVAPLAVGAPARLGLLAAGLGVMVGLICLLSGLLRLGFVANFLSKPVITGFLHGLALVIVGAQLPKVLGLKVEGATTLDQFVATVRHLGQTNLATLATLAIGASCLVVILLCRRFAPRVPGAVLALAGS